MKSRCLIPAVLSVIFNYVSCLTSATTNTYIRTPGKSLPGPIPTNSFKVTQNVSLSQCAAECSLEFHMNQFHCYAFEYVSPTKTCVLTNVTTLVLKGGYLGLLTNTHMEYFERSKGHYANLFQPYPNQYLKDQSSYFTVFHNMTLEKCALYCLLESRDTCMSFSYSETKQVCGLSKVFYSESNNQQLVTSDGGYTHYQYFTTWPCNATIPWNYSPRAIASPYFPYASVQDVNCHVTIEAPKGKQIDLTFSTFFTKGDVCVSTDTGITVYDGETSGSAMMSRLCTSDKFVDRLFQSSSGYLHVKYSTGSIPMAFKAVYDFIQVDPCLSGPCRNNATCENNDGIFSCACLPGFTGSLCEEDIDDCTSSPCYMGGQCVDLVNGFHCNCPRLLGGKLCDEFVGLCYASPCENGGTCSPRGTSSYVCSCPGGFTGQNCSSALPDPCRDQPCQNGGICETDIARGTFQCTCKPGFDGDFCENNIDDCASSPCLHNIPCTDLVNDFHCACPDFMGGKTCSEFVGRCHDDPCKNGKCVPTGRDNYTCVCDQSFTGKHCETLFINFCNPNPCRYGHCTSFPDGPACDCDFGYDGFFCDQRTNFCENVRCVHGECVNVDDDFQCSCIPGYEGRFCNQTVNHCATADCHGGYCINTMTSHFCVCIDGRTAADCAVEADRCGNVVCKNGTCVENDDGLMSCQCSHGYTGPACDAVIDNCFNNQCIHGVCTSTISGLTCSCDENYTGSECDVIIDPCKDNQCIYGFCLSRNQSYECICAEGYHGDQCQYLPGEPETTTTTSTARPTSQTMTLRCSKATCIHGTCDEDFPNVCFCQPGFSGETCGHFEGCSRHNPCLHGNCTDADDGYVCSCEDGYVGTNCRVLDACKSNPCESGLCTQFGDTGFRCVLYPLIGTNNNSHASFPFWMVCTEELLSKVDVFSLQGFQLPMMASSAQSSTEFDIVDIKEHDDLVLFSNVISCYRSDRDITVNYLLGNNVPDTTWDWIGIFPVGWRVLGEYVTYRWTPVQSPDCTAPRRRAVVFPHTVHQMHSNRMDTYQFLYVSRGNHVVGVSSPFNVYDEEDLDDYNLDTLFSDKPDGSAVCSANALRRKATAPLEDNFEIVSELDCSFSPKIKIRRKDKVTTVYRDTESLVNLPDFQEWARKLRFINMNPLVQDYRTFASRVPSQSKVDLLPVYNIRWVGPASFSGCERQALPFQLATPGIVRNPMLPSIEYPALGTLRSGPVAFLESFINKCPGCMHDQQKDLYQSILYREFDYQRIARTLILDMLEKAKLQEERLESVREQVTRLQREESIRSVGVLDFAVTELLKDNERLQQRVDDLELQLAAERSKSGTYQEEDSTSGWKIIDPKRIVRLKGVIWRQCHTVQVLRQCYDTRRRQVFRLISENSRLRDLVKSAFEASNRFRELSEELNQRIRAVLASRNKDFTNEWRQFAKQVKETTTQTNEPCSQSSSSSSEQDRSSDLSPQPLPRKQIKNKQICKLLKSEKNRKQKLHKRRAEAEQCPTCGLKFSRKADKRVIEEHLVFHDRMGN